MSKTIGFLGLGHMGGPMAANLVEAGYDVYAFDPSTAAQEQALQDGATVVDTGVAAATDRDIVITMLTNGGNTKDLYHDLYGEIMSELAGVEVPAPIAPAPDAPAFEPETYVGRYERTSTRIEVTAEDGALSARITATGPLADLADEATHEYALTPVSADTFVLRPPGARTWSSMVFYRLPDGSRYVHHGGRATPLVST